MSRLFITPRELNLIADWTNEIIKDVAGQKIVYYSISELKTRVHDLYNESPEKVFDNPVIIDGLIGQPEYETRTDQFSSDNTSRIEAYLPTRDLINKGITVSTGDFFSYGEYMYEISAVNPMKPIYGQVEHNDGVKVIASRARDGALKAKIIGPTNQKYTDPDAVQTEFVQQRGLPENKNGATGDKRELIENGTLDSPSEGQREVSSAAGGTAGPGFYEDSQ